MIDLAVIMSIYHKDKLCFVKESVQSILNQTFKDFHYYLIFDGPVSADVENYITSLPDNRIRLHRLKKNCGLAIALNYLLEIILKNPDYRYIARMDADDISMPERFEKQLNYLSKNSEISCLGSWYEEIDEDGNSISFQKLPVQHEKILKYFYRRSPIAHPSVMLHRRMFIESGLYPTNTIRLEDYALWGNAVCSGMFFSNIPYFLVKLRRDKDFYYRHSGLKFGFNYLRTRFRINRQIKSPLVFYFYSIFVGVIRMSPGSVIKCIYEIDRKNVFHTY